MTAMRLFLSHATEDAELARLFAAYLQKAGDVVEPSAERGPESLVQANRMVVILTRAYLDGPLRQELRWWLAQGDAEERLTLLRAEDVRLPEQLRLIGYVDLVGLRAERLRARLLDSVRRGSARRGPAPAEPDMPQRQEAAARSRPELPVRNKDFVGRATVLEDLARSLQTHGRSVLYAGDGAAGIGKSQLAIEYAYRHSTGTGTHRYYDLVVWINAEHQDLIADQLARAAVVAGLCSPGSTVTNARLAPARHFREQNRWLAVFDNAETPDVAPWFPKGRGQAPPWPASSSGAMPRPRCRWPRRCSTGCARRSSPTTSTRSTRRGSWPTAVPRPVITRARWRWTRSWSIAAPTCSAKITC